MSHTAFTNGSAKPLDQPLCHIVLAGVVDHLFGLDDFAGHVVQVAQLVGQTHVNGLLAGPEQAAEGLGRFLEPFAAARLSPR
jgi:hypothetical protein